MKSSYPDTELTHLKPSPMEEVDKVLARPPQTAFGYPREFLENRFVYVVISPRARGLAIGINMNPDRQCNFDCSYCEVDHLATPMAKELDLDIMAAELEYTLGQVRSGRLSEHPHFRSIHPDLLRLRHVALSGDGEPTLSPRFAEAVQVAVHVRARCLGSFFKLVLMTNSTGLDVPMVRHGLRYFTREDEVWAKLEAGTQPYMDLVNHSEVPLEKILSNILLLGRERPVVIQSMFPLINGQEPGADEIEEYINRLNELKHGGAQISLVQIYSASRPHAHPEFSHLPLKILSRICQRVKAATGLKAEVF